MASSRLEKIGTIFTRVNGLLKTGSMKWEDRPLWYDIYKAFPPKDEPKYDRPAPDIEVQNIFYEEDQIRALYHKNNKNVGTVNMFNNETQTRTMKFIEIYKKLQESGSQKPMEIYDNAIQLLNQQPETSSLVNTFKEAQDQKIVNKVDVVKIFKEE